MFTRYQNVQAQHKDPLYLFFEMKIFQTEHFETYSAMKQQVHVLNTIQCSAMAIW